MRALGDRYVKDEFRQHRSANAEFLPRFFGEWEKYATHLQQGRQRGRVWKAHWRGGANMTEEQKAMLAKLAEETRKL